MSLLANEYDVRSVLHGQVHARIQEFSSGGPGQSDKKGSDKVVVVVLFFFVVVGFF